MRSRTNMSFGCGVAVLVLLAAVRPTAGARPVQVPVVYYKLPNGLKVVISEDHIAPVVTVAVYYNVGFRVEPKGRTGFAHLFEHMMFQGSANVKKFEHAKYVEQNGGNLNGHTDFDYTNYFETLPSNRVELGLWLESDRMRSLDVSAENLKNQQNVVSEEIRVNVLNQPYQLFEWIELWKNAFQNWNNAHNGYGDLEEVNAATLDDVRSFFKTFYAPNNAVLAVVGDVDAGAIKAMVEKHFATIPSQPAPVKPDLAEPLQNSPEYPAAALMSLILQGDESSRLYQRLVKDKEISLDMGGGLNYFGNEFDYNGPMVMTTRTTYKPGHSGTEVVKEMDAVIAELVQKGLPERELADAKVRFRSNFYSQLESSFGKAHLLCVLSLFRDDPAQINSLLEPFEKVTPEQVVSVTKKYLVAGNRTVIDRVPETKGGM